MTDLCPYCERGPMEPFIAEETIAVAGVPVVVGDLHMARCPVCGEEWAPWQEAAHNNAQYAAARQAVPTHLWREVDGQMVPATFMEWATWFEDTAGRRVAYSEFEGDVNLSTVGVGANPGREQYETALLGPDHTEVLQRHVTRAEALANHALWEARITQWLCVQGLGVANMLRWMPRELGAPK